MNELIDLIEREDTAAKNKGSKRIKANDTFWSKAVNLDKSVISYFFLLMWAIANGISRSSINDPLFDAFLKSIGTEPASNRQILQSQHLVAIDVRVGINDSKSAMSVALASNGWRYRARHDWINVVICFIVNSVSKEPKWEIRVIEPDLIFLPQAQLLIRSRT